MGVFSHGEYNEQVLEAKKSIIHDEIAVFVKMIDSFYRFLKTLTPNFYPIGKPAQSNPEKDKIEKKMSPDI